MNLDTNILNNSVVGKDVIKQKYVPADINIWLDYRNRIDEIKKEGKYPPNYIYGELQAIDHILEYLSKHP